MSFTLTDNGTEAIAIIESPTSEPKYVFLDQNTAHEVSPSCILDESLDQATINQLTNSLARGMSLREMVSLLEEHPETSAPTSSINLFDTPETMRVMPSEKPERVLIAGQAGCGKTTLAREYAEMYHVMYPNNLIWVFAREEDDSAFDGLRRTQIVVDTSLPEYAQDIDDILNQEISLQQLAGDTGALVIFDDMDNLQEKKLLSAVHKLMADIVTNGRKRGLYCIYISHLLMNYQQTRIINNEANKVFMFPGAGTSQIEKYLKAYAAMKSHEIEHIVRVGSRWVMLQRNIPRYVIYQKGAFLV